MFKGLSTIYKKLSQLIIARLEGDKIADERYQKTIISLVNKGVGGFILFGGTKDKIKKFIEFLQNIAEIPLFIASDVERGVGQQINGATLFPCSMALSSALKRGRKIDSLILESMIKTVAEEALDIGINMPLIPVLDVNKNPENPIICTRAFSDEPKIVAWFGSHFIKILQNNGLLPCAKHFPGHGDTSVDSHISLPIINKTKADLMAEDILPFRESIELGLRSIMVGHLVVTEIDNKPASLSKKIITDFLKGELGYKGLVLTDALNMNALRGFKSVPVESLKAGADILLHPVDFEQTIDELLMAVETNELDEGQIDNALKNIFKTKSMLQLGGESIVNYCSNKDISEKICDMSICLVKDTPNILPLTNIDKVQVYLFGEKKFHNSSLFKNFLNTQSQKNDSETAIVAIFSEVSAWRGNSGIIEGEIQKIHEIIKKSPKSIVISFGSPYLLRHFTNADILISAYESSEQVQRSVIKCLKGDIPFEGIMPVNLFK